MPEFKNWNLTTNRLCLTPFLDTDLNKFLTFINHPTFKNCFWDTNFIDLLFAEKILTENIQLFSEKSYGLWKVSLRDGEGFMGIVGFWHYSYDSIPQLIYGILPEYSRMGYILEACRKLIDYAFNQLKLPKVIASCEINNLDSIKVCKNLNMNFVEEKKIGLETFLFYQLPSYPF